MSGRVEIRDGLMWTIFEGVVTAADLEEAGDAAEGLDEESSALDRMSDLRTVTGIELTYLDIMAYASRRMRQELPRPVRSAIVVEDAAVRSAAEVFLLLNRNPHITLQIFDTMEGALDWVRPAGASRTDSP